MLTYPARTSSSTMQQSSALTTSLFSTPNQQEKQQNNSKLLRFHIVLQASTAISQKSEGAPITYLNRGQSYSIHLNDRFCEDSIIHSQFIITFHDPSHQKIAVNYWRFWISQQKDSQHARAVDVDMSQSTGILNVKYPSFDRIDFYWHGRNGAKLSLKFHCLSTDFSRIKGVKGIPLRAYVSSQMTTSMDPLLMCQYSGSFIPSRKTDNSSPTYLDYNEHCYCKVKLFRDKGAERKNKDDAKQIKRQFEKMMTDGDKNIHPIWLMYNESIPYSTLGEIPTSPILGTYDDVINNNNEIPPLLEIKSKLKGHSLPSIYDSHHHHHHHHPYDKSISTQFPTLSSSSSSPSLSYMPSSPSPLPILSHSTITIPSQLYQGYESKISTSPVISNNSNNSFQFPSSFYLPSTPFRLKDISSQSSASQIEPDDLSSMPTLDPLNPHWKKSS